MNSIIIGAGEVGKGLQQVIGGDIMDKVVDTTKSYDIIHICFPYSDKFKDFVKQYKKVFKAKYVVIHSTVPVGTSKSLKAIHSPIRGVHPYLDKGIRTFVKYFGGKDAGKIAKIYSNCFPVKVVKDSDTTEAIKLWDTTQYGAMILLNKEIHDWCIKHKVDFDIVYTDANETYNDGYEKLGREEVVRPYLKYMDGKIGGHCVANNVELFESETCTKIKNYQKKYAV